LAKGSRRDLLAKVILLPFAAIARHSRHDRGRIGFAGRGAIIGLAERLAALPEERVPVVVAAYGLSDEGLSLRASCSLSFHHAAPVI
jgi:hypothetical protein